MNLRIYSDGKRWKVDRDGLSVAELAEPESAIRAAHKLAAEAGAEEPVSITVEPAPEPGPLRLFLVDEQGYRPSAYKRSWVIEARTQREASERVYVAVASEHRYPTSLAFDHVGNNDRSYRISRREVRPWELETLRVFAFEPPPAPPQPKKKSRPTAPWV